jgi:GNAT superfamily N-acetyltransferase
LARAITDFNLAHLPPNSSNNMMALGYVLKEPLFGLVGGITGKVLLGNCLSIDILWVYEKYRNQGYATQLLQAIEQGARSVGSKLSQVDTFDFQALGFYEKNGYEIFGVLEDNPCEGNKRYYLKKKL